MVPLLEKIEVLKAIAHPVRIGILEELMKGAKCVSDFEGFSDVNQPNFSLHLSVLRDHGVIDYFADGRLRCYFLVSPLIPEVIKALEKERDPLPAPSSCTASRKGKYPGERRR